MLHGDKGAVVQAHGELPRPGARTSEAVAEGLPLHGRHVSQGAQAKAAHLRRDRGGDREQVHRAGRQETGRVRRDPGCSQGRAGPGGNEGGKLGVSHAGPGLQVPGHGVQQGGHQRVLAAVQGFQPVQAHVGCAQSGALDPVADSLQGEEHPVEYSPVSGLIGFQYRAVGVPGQGLFQGHARRRPVGGGKVVDDQGPALGAVHHQGGAVLQVGLPLHLQLGPQVGDQHAGHPHDCSSSAH